VRWKSNQSSGGTGGDSTERLPCDADADADALPSRRRSAHTADAPWFGIARTDAHVASRQSPT
jgi:hypothetical protein